MSGKARPAGAQRFSPATTPSLPPQLVACGDRDFYRITRESLEVFGLAARIPPPQIRGSAVAGRTARVDVAEPLNLIPFSKKSVVVIAKHNVFRYELGRRKAISLAPIPTPGPLVAWTDPHSPDAFWVRALGARSLEEYTVSSLARSDPAKGVKELPEFDSRLFTVLADGAPLYSTPKGLIRWGDESRPVPFPGLSGPATVLFPDASSNRYWAGDAAGNVGLWDTNQGKSPVFTARVPGVVIDAALRGTTLAVLSMELSGSLYRPSLTIFSKGAEQGRLSVGPSMASSGQPELDLCLIAERPWVVVGGRNWLQLLDWSNRRLLAEW